MRVALIARRFDPAGGGTERDLIVTAQCLADAGHDITVYTAEARGIVAAMARGAGRLAMAGRAVPPDALCMGGAGAGAARRRGVGA